jgi:uncharacterized membrane protein
VNAYPWLLFLHILAAVVWVGGAIMLNILNTRSIRSADPARVITAARETAWVGTRVIAPSTLVLLALGIIMVLISDAWTIGQLWIILALVLWGITFATGAFYLGPEAGRIGKLIDERNPTPRSRGGSAGWCWWDGSTWSR